MQIYTPRNPGILEQCQGLGMWLFFEKNRSMYYILNTVVEQGLVLALEIWKLKLISFIGEHLDYFLFLLISRTGTVG